MKRISMLFAVAATSLTLAACGASSTDSTAPTSGPASSAGTGQNNHNAQDVSFTQDMVPHHMQAVQMAELATTRAASPEVKALAARIRSEQDPEIATMTTWLRSWGQPVSMPSAGSTTMGGMGNGDAGGGSGMMSDADMASLAATTGAAFGREFLTTMTEHHSGAVEMARTEQQRGRYGPAKTLADNIVTSQTAEIAQMKTLLTQM